MTRPTNDELRDRIDANVADAEAWDIMRSRAKSGDADAQQFLDTEDDND